ncbi:MAG: NADH-quinone oxidoreductase subunit M [Chloroflexi bacterium ADurb.Bin325]|nr:MAG: NADH-quinone oxidoreductase subunit M [Chloroflexi bacterium ADurb.Bin325]
MPWISAYHINYRLGVDGLSVLLIVMTGFLSFLATFVAFPIKKHVKGFFALYLLLVTGMMGVFMALDFFLFYVFWEVMLLPMYFLIGIWGGPRKEYAAIKFFLYTLLGSVLILLVMLAYYFKMQTFAGGQYAQYAFDIPQLVALQPFDIPGGPTLFQHLMFWGLFIGFAIKVPIFPFHTWLPDAHTAAPTAGSVILAGVLLKLGAYGIIRIALPVFPDAAKRYALVIVILGVISIIYGALVSLAQWDLKRLIAYSSVSHMGYVLLGVGAAAYAIGNPAWVGAGAMALNGAAFQMFSHGLSTGALFFLVGVIYERAHLRDLKMFGGLSAKMPYYYGLFAVAAFTSLGLPSLAGFWGELFVFRGAFEIVRLWAAVGILGLVLTAAYILWKIVQYTFLGEYDPHKIAHWSDVETGAELHEPKDVASFEKVTLWPLVAFMILFGFFPAPLLNFFDTAFMALMNGFAGK